jgi:uncharacterized protein YsxB (DUF464 family)
MIRVVFTQHHDIPAGFELRGHAGAGSAGNDIVCAAVSSAVYMTANTVTEILGVNAGIKEKNGYMKVIIPEEDRSRCEAVMAGLKLHLTALAGQYPRNIHISFTEV